MRRFARVVALIAILGLLSTPLAAQRCLGYAPFSAGNLRVGLNFTFPDQAKSYALEAAAGGDVGLYGAGQFGQIAINAGGGVIKILGFGAGYVIPIADGARVALCPVAEIVFTSGPDVSQLVTSGRNATFGVAMGGVAASSPSLRLIPGLGAGFDLVPFTSLHFTNALSRRSQAGPDVDTDTNFWDVGIGAGLVFGKVITLRPSLVIPFGVSGAKTVLAIGLGFSFGEPEPDP